MNLDHTTHIGHGFACVSPNPTQSSWVNQSALCIILSQVGDTCIGSTKLGWLVRLPCCYRFRISSTVLFERQWSYWSSSSILLLYQTHFWWFLEIQWLQWAASHWQACSGGWGRVPERIWRQGSISQLQWVRFRYSRSRITVSCNKSIIKLTHHVTSMGK